MKHRTFLRLRQLKNILLQRYLFEANVYYSFKNTRCREARLNKKSEWNLIFFIWAEEIKAPHPQKIFSRTKLLVRSTKEKNNSKT